MANNLFISYDLYAPGQAYNKVIEAIKSHGNWAKVHKSLWYLKSNSTAEKIANDIWSVMDKNDTLIVIDTSNGTAYWFNVSQKVSDFLKQNWFK